MPDINGAEEDNGFTVQDPAVSLPPGFRWNDKWELRADRVVDPDLRGMIEASFKGNGLALIEAAYAAGLVDPRFRTVNQSLLARLRDHIAFERRVTPQIVQDTFEAAVIAAQGVRTND